MSWQAYVDGQICNLVPCEFAIIAGLQTGQVWAQKIDCNLTITEDEIRLIANKIVSDPKYFQQNGIFLGGEKYFCITAEKNLVRGRKNKNALCIVATATCLLIAVCKDGIAPGILNNVVEKLGDYLKQAQF